MMKRFNQVFLLILMALTVFNACEKDELKETTNAESTEILEDVSKHMLSFDSFKQFQDEAYRVANFTPDELKEWEQDKGFKSFGSYSDDLIDFITEENFQSEKDVVEYIKGYPEYIELVDDIDIEPRLYFTPYRFLLNAECKCVVGHNIVLVNKKGVFIAEDGKSGSNFSSRDTVVVFQFATHNKNNCPLKTHVTNNGYKMKIDISFNIYSYPKPVFNEHMHRCEIHTKSMKKIRKKYRGVRRTHRVSGSLEVMYYQQGWHSIESNVNYSKEKIDYYWNADIVYSFGSVYPLEFGNYNISGHFAGLDGSQVLLRCNN